MQPVKVQLFLPGWGINNSEGLWEGVWVACDARAAVVIVGKSVVYAPVECLEVLEDVTCAAKGFSVFEPNSGSREPVVDGSATSPAGYKVGDVVRGLDGKDHVVTVVGPVRKRRRKRASPPRGPRSNQWTPPKPE